MAQIFDTHEAVKSLIASGLDEKQAEAITTTTRKLAETNLATKPDIAELKGELGKMDGKVEGIRYVNLLLLALVTGIALKLFFFS